MSEPIENDRKLRDFSRGCPGGTDKPFFALGEPLMLVISPNKKKVECWSEFPRLDATSSLGPAEQSFDPWFEPISNGQTVEKAIDPLREVPDQAGYINDQAIAHSALPENIERFALELLNVVKNELRDENGNINNSAHQKLADAFRASANPSDLADTLTTLGREEHIQITYDHGIHFHNYQSINGLEFPVSGILFEYNSQIPQGKPMGVSGEQLKPLADTIRDATTLEGDFTRLALAEIGMKPDFVLLERVASMNALLANTGNPKQLVELLNKQISQDDQAVNRHGLNYINEVKIRIDYPRAPRAVSDRADNPAPRLRVMDLGNTFLWTIDLNK
jgi:hypothetical protein